MSKDATHDDVSRLYHERPFPLEGDMPDKKKLRSESYTNMPSESHQESSRSPIDEVNWSLNETGTTFTECISEIDELLEPDEGMSSHDQEKRRVNQASVLTDCTSLLPPPQVDCEMMGAHDSSQVTHGGISSHDHESPQSLEGDANPDLNNENASIDEFAGIFQKIHITSEDLPAVRMLIQSGALQEDQVTTEENRHDDNDGMAQVLEKTKTDFSDGEDENEDMGMSHPSKDASSLDVDLNLRAYQKELARNALEGKNTIICAPTGCGKTRVAVDIIIKHLNGPEGDTSKLKKVCFFTQTVPLAVQQHDAIRKKLPEKYKINIFTGGSKISSDMHLLLDDLDVVVLTPMILQNHISRRNVRDLSVFSLLIFDECHHTREKEPYNTLMASYVDKKLEDGGHDLPQVVGLTASFPVGKADHVPGAVDSILQLCANMDAHLISVVEEHKDELDRLVPVPNENMERLQKREDDESYKMLIDAMKRLETDAADCAMDLGDRVLRTIVFECPSANRKLQKYNNWAVNLSDQTVLLPRTSGKSNLLVRRLLLIAQYLMKYHSALETHDLVHLHDVVGYLNDCFAEYRRNESKTGREASLHDYFNKELKKRMQSMSHEENPNLRHLVKIIDEKLLKVSCSSRGIIFVRTRAIAEALVSWLNRNQRQEIRNLKASIFTGANAKESQGGMTQAQQNALVEMFREGSVRLLVATSVAEEGMDVPECNLVIKYNHVGNEITTIQTRGRSRKIGGHSVLLAMNEICDKETINKKRTELMYKGIEQVRKMNPTNLRLRVEKCQKKDQDKRKLEKRNELITKAKNQGKKFTMICKLCKKFSIHSDDIRTLFQNHRVVVDRNVWAHNKIFITDKNTFGGIQFVGKVRCDIELEDASRCREPLGHLVYYNSNFFLALGIEHYVIHGDNQSEPKDMKVKKWKSLPYSIPEINLDDIDNYNKQETDNDSSNF